MTTKTVDFNKAYQHYQAFHQTGNKAELDQAVQLLLPYLESYSRSLSKNYQHGPLQSRIDEDECLSLTGLMTTKILSTNAELKSGAHLHAYLSTAISNAFISLERHLLHVQKQELNYARQCKQANRSHDSETSNSKAFTPSAKQVHQVMDIVAGALPQPHWRDTLLRTIENDTRATPLIQKKVAEAAGVRSNVWRGRVRMARNIIENSPAAEAIFKALSASPHEGHNR
jgi:hypothetical protein